MTGIFLRFYNLGKYDFWFDEILSISFASNIDKFNIIDSYIDTPPLFYFLLSFWLRLGNSEFILRLLPFIFGVLSIPAIYLVGRKLFDKKVGLIAAFILAISPFHVYYSQELRTYTLVTFLALMTIYYLIKSLKENKISYWVGFIIFTTLTLYSHNIALFLMIAVNCYFFLFYKKYKVLLRRWLISQFFVFLLYLPWVKIGFEQLLQSKATEALGWIPKGYLFNFIRTFFIFNVGCNAHETTHVLALLLIFTLFLLSIWNIENKEIYLLLCWLFIPIAISIVISKLITWVFLFKTLIYVSSAYYLLISYGLSKIKPNKAFLCFLLLFSILSGLSLKNYYQSIFYSDKYNFYSSVKFNKEIKLAAGYINQNYKKGDIVLHACQATNQPFAYYHNNKLEEKLLFLEHNYRLTIHPSKFYLFHLMLLKKIKFTYINLEGVKNSNYKRIWLVLSTWDNQPDELLKYIEDYFDINYTMVDCKGFKGIKLCLYQTK